MLKRLLVRCLAFVQAFQEIIVYCYNSVGRSNFNVILNEIHYYLLSNDYLMLEFLEKMKESLSKSRDCKLPKYSFTLLGLGKKKCSIEKTSM